MYGCRSPLDDSASLADITSSAESASQKGGPDPGRRRPLTHAGWVHRRSHGPDPRRPLAARSLPDGTPARPGSQHRRVPIKIGQRSQTCHPCRRWRSPRIAAVNKPPQVPTFKGRSRRLGGHIDVGVPHDLGIQGRSPGHHPRDEDVGTRSSVHALGRRPGIPIGRPMLLHLGTNPANCRSSRIEVGREIVGM